MKTFTFVLVIVISFSHIILAQYQNVEVGDAINTYEPEEVSVVLNPLNTNHILVGANTVNYYFSTYG